MNDRGRGSLDDAVTQGLSRCMAHLDLDTVFASVESLEHPELKGHPVIVGGRRPVAVVPERPYLRLKEYAGRGNAQGQRLDEDLPAHEPTELCDGAKQ
jgi:hypothetical protein